MKHSPRQKRLLLALEKRLEALTEGLESIEVQGKGIDLVKEIKELHAMLDALNGTATAARSVEAASQPRVIVVWGDSATLPPCGTGQRTASAQTKATSGQAKTTDKSKTATAAKSRLVKTHSAAVGKVARQTKPVTA